MNILEIAKQMNNKSKLEYRIAALLSFKADITSWITIDEKEIKYIMSLVKDLNSFVDYLREKQDDK